MIEPSPDKIARLDEEDLLCLYAPGLAELTPTDRLYFEGLSQQDNLALIALNSRLQEVLESTGIHPAIVNNIYWRSTLIKEIPRSPEDGDFITEQRNIAMLTPSQVDVNRAREIIREQARHSIDILIGQNKVEPTDREQLISSVSNTLMWRFRKHLRRLKKKPIVRKNISGSEADKSKREFLSFLELKEIAEGMEAHEDKGFSNDQLLAIFLVKSGIMNVDRITSTEGKSTYSPSIFITEASFIDSPNPDPSTMKLIHECVGDAKSILRKVVLRVAKIIRKNARALSSKYGNEQLSMPNLNTSLLNSHPYVLLRKFFSGELRNVDAAEVQKALSMGFRLIQYRMHPSNIASKGKEAMLSNAVNSLCESNEDGDPIFYEGIYPLYEYTEEWTGSEYQKELIGQFEDTGLSALLPVRNLKIDGYDDIPEAHTVYLSDVSRKDSEAMIMKEFGEKHSGSEPEDIHDQLRTRIVLWGIKSSDLNEDNPKSQRYKKYLRAIGEELVNNLGLEHVSRDFSELEPGQAIFNDSKLDKGEFRKFTILAKTIEGVNVEVQIVPFDTFMMDNAKDSPMEHENYKNSRMDHSGRLTVPYSQYPHAHYAMDLEKEKYEVSRKAATKALCTAMPTLKTGERGERMN